MRGLRVGIIGAGRSGMAAVQLLQRLGAKVLLSESGRITGKIPRGIDVETGFHSDRLLDCNLIIRSPGVPNRLPILKALEKKGTPVWSELELASRYTTAKNLIAITGTNGKTTTTTLVGEIFKATRQPTFVAGNIGAPLSTVAQKTNTHANVILEVSSYQLEDIETFHPTISAILNVTPDHLEHHGTMQAYAAAKARIFENQTGKDVCVLNADDAWCRRLAKRCPARVFFFSRRQTLKQGIYMEKGDVVVRWKTLRARWALKSNLPGPHNIENILASAAMALAAGVPVKTIQQVLARFQGVEHRLEWVRTLRGVRYINDSKGTNVDSTRVALASFTEPLVVIMGGEGKGSPYQPLSALIRQRVKQLLLIGEDAPVIAKAFKGLVPIQTLRDLTQAVPRASRLAQPGDIVLLSPACASFDQYNNYEERGRHFKTLVRKLK